MHIYKNEEARYETLIKNTNNKMLCTICTTLRNGGQHSEGLK